MSNSRSANACPARHSKIANRRSTSAFTLIEILIVVAIMGLAGAIVVPQMLAAGTMGIQAAARNVIADLLYAQNEAIASQSERRVVFDLAENTYRITDAAGTTVTVDWKAGDSENYVVDFDSESSRYGRVKLVAADFGGDAQVAFDALGAPSSGGTVEIQFQDTKYVVTLAAFTGRVTVRKQDVAEEE